MAGVNPQILKEQVGTGEASLRPKGPLPPSEASHLGSSNEVLACTL